MRVELLDDARGRRGAIWWSARGLLVDLSGRTRATRTTGRGRNDAPNDWGDDGDSTRDRRQVRVGERRRGVGRARHRPTVNAPMPRKRKLRPPTPSVRQSRRMAVAVGHPFRTVGDAVSYRISGGGKQSKIIQAESR